MKGVCLVTAVLGFLALVHCAGDDIFSEAPTSTDLAVIDLPNPIAIQVSETLAKVFVLNSDGGGSYDTGSLTQLSFSATDTNAPTLGADLIVSVEQFGADMLIDDTDTLAFVSNRKSDIEGASDDHVYQFQIGNGSLALTSSVTVGANPFGLALLNNQDLFVVSDEQIDRVSALDLSAIATIDLSQITEVSTARVEGAAIDQTNGWLFVSNRTDCILVIDTDDNSVDYCIQGPDNTGAIAFGGGRLYVAEGFPASLLVMDPSNLSKQDTLTTIDDSELLLGTAPLGDDPGQIALDLPNSRAYVSNTADDTISVIDTDLIEELDRISLDEDDIDASFSDGRQPFDIDVGTFNGISYIFVANYESNTISVIHGGTLEVVSTFPE